MNLLGKSALAAAIIIIILTPVSAQKWEKSLDKIALQFNIGNYSRASKLNEKLKKRSSKN